MQRLACPGCAISKSLTLQNVQLAESIADNEDAMEKLRKIQLAKRHFENNSIAFIYIYSFALAIDCDVKSCQSSDSKFE